MLFPHLHSNRRDAPLRARQVELGPLCFAEFAWPHEKEWRELQSVLGRSLPVIPIDRTEQLANSSRIGNRWMVSDDHWRERTSKIRCDVALCASGGDRITENLTAFRTQPVRSLIDASGLDPLGKR